MLDDAALARLIRSARSIAARFEAVQDNTAAKRRRDDRAERVRRCRAR